MHRKSKFIALTALVLTAALLSNTALLGPATLKAQFELIPSDTQDRVLVLADQSLLESNEDFEGLSEEFSGLNRTTLSRRANRYAQDIQDKLTNSQVDLVAISPNKSPAEVASMLKNQYFEGNLKGITVIGNVPLPVVNKNGNRFISLYPYTDFEDPAYVHDAQTGYFVPNDLSLDIEPEIWHGVIQFETPEEYAIYLDKNHLYHEGRDGFDQFDEKIFYADPIAESRALNSSLISNYQNYLRNLGEIAYNRYSRKLLNQVSTEFTNDIRENIQVESLSELLESTLSSTETLPDIQTKPLIDNYLNRVTDLFSNAATAERTALLGTGRYDEGDYYTPINFIAQKDEYLIQYFLQVNTLLENRIDQILNEVQEDMRIPNGSILSGTVQLAGSDELIDIDPIYFVNNAPTPSFRRDFNTDLQSPFTPSDVEEYIDSKGGETAWIQSINSMINGQASITEASQCRLFRGGGQISELGKTVEIWRRNISITNEDGTTSQICASPWQGADNESTWQAANKSSCTLFYGQNIKDEYRSKERVVDYQSLMTHEACFNMRPLNTYLSLINNSSSLSTEQKNQIANSAINPNAINLTADGITLSLGGLLEDLPGYNSEPGDWNAWSSYLLSNPVKNIFTIPNPTPSIESVNLEVTKLGMANPISSVVYHKDPTQDIIQKASEGLSTNDLPMDQVRYVTYIDSSGEKQELIYPDLFTTTTLEELQTRLQEIEAQLGAEYAGELTSLIQSSSDIFNDDLTSISQASSQSLQDFIDWRNLSLNQKYTQTLNSLLDSQTPTNLATGPDTFEIAVLTSDANQDGLNYSLLTEEAFGVNPNLLTPSEQDFAQQFEQQEDQRQRDNNRGPDFSVQSVPLLEWFNDYLPQWLEESSDFGSFGFKPESPGLPSYEETIRSDQTEIAEILIETEADHISLEGQTNRQLNLTVVDTEGRKVVGEPVYITLDARGAQIESDADKNPNENGIQLFMLSGSSTVNYTPNAAGDIVFTADLSPLRASKQITAHESLATQINFESNSTQVGNTEGVRFTINQVNEDGQKVPAPTPSISLDNNTFGNLQSLTELQTADDFNYQFLPTTKAGQVNLIAQFPEARPAKESIRVNPGSAQRLYFAQNKTSLTETTEIPVQLLDQYGNKIQTDPTELTVTISNADKVDLQTPTTTLSEGQATIRVRPRANTFGNVFVRVEGPGLDPAYHKLELGSTLSNEDFQSLQVSALYLELRTSQRPPSLLTQGKTQTISTLSTDLSGPSPILYLHPTGGLELIQANRISSTLSIGEDNIQAKIYDNQNREIATASITTSSLEFLGFSDQIDQSGIFIDNQINGVQLKENPLSYNDQEVLRISENGIPIILDNQFNLRLKSNTQFFTLEVYQGNTVLADIIYNFDTTGAVTLSPADHPEIQYRQTHTLPSSSAPLGLVFFSPNSTLSTEQLPSGGDIRLEDSLDTELVGLREGHKSILLLSAGHSAGEANRPYLSEAGIVLGDPTIQLPETENYSASNQIGYDTGKYLGRTESEIVSLLEKDDYVLIADSNGYISRLNKETLELTKNLTRVPNGIKEIKDFDDQILVLSEESCFQEDSCVYLLDSDGQIIPIPLETDTKISQVFTADFTDDNDLDIAVLTEGQNLRLFLNRDGQIDEEGSLIGTTSNNLNTTQNLISNVWIQDPNGAYSMSVQTTPIQTTTTASQDGRLVQTNQSAPQYQQFTFSAVPDNESLSASTLRVADANGGELRNNDLVNFTLTLNSEGFAINDGAISVPLSGNYEFLPESLSGDYTTIATNDPSRPYLISGINLSGGQTIQLSFQARYIVTGDEPEPVVQLVTDDEGYPADGVPDFKVSLPGTNVTTYYYSDLSDGSLSFERLERNLGSTEVPDQSDLIPDNLAESSERESSSYARSLRSSISESDSDGDGILDTYDSLNQGLSNVANDVEDLVKNASCGDGGCLAVPYNHAFLVPGSSTGPVPVVGWGCPSLGSPLFGQAAVSCAAGRIYLSPTLTGEFASSVCLGPFGAGQNCFTTRLGNLGSLCDRINAGIQDLLNGATEFVEDAAGAVVNISPGDGGGSSNVQLPGFPAVFTNWVTAQLEEIQTNLFDLPDITIIYPEVISLVGRSEENADVDYMFLEGVLAEVNSMPLFNIETETHYLKYPVISVDELTKYRAQLVELWESNKTIIRRALTQWGCYGENLDSFANFEANLLSGDLQLAAGASNECISLATTTLQIQTSIDANLEALERYRDLPRDIFEAENFLAEYAVGILGYAEVILDNTAGYLARNRAALEAWQQMFIDLQNIVAEFSAILDIFINFQESCDTCQTTRTDFNYQLLLRPFLNAILLPPVVLMPKLPDITIDVSQVEAGADIVLPKFEFKPEPLSLPDLNQFIISLPDAPPINFQARLPEFGLSALPVLPEPPDLGKYILEMPELPELELPSLPEIPLPPEIDPANLGFEFFDQIEGTLETVNTVLRIICLIKKGFIPVNELAIKGQIEGMTARPLDVILPIDIGFGFNTPGFEITYLDEVRFILESRFNFEFDDINQAAENLTEEFNKFDTNLRENIDQRATEVIDLLPDEDVTVPGDIEDIDVDIDLETEAYIQATESLHALNQAMIDFNSQIPSEIKLIATTQTVSQPEFTEINLDRDFAIPQRLADQINTLLAYDPIDTSNVMVADNTQNIPSGNPGTINTSTFQVAQVNSTNPSTQGAEFSPNAGLYYFNNETQTSEHIVRYQAEGNQQVQILSSDLDGDRDSDILYTRGKEIYFKQGLENNRTPRRSAGRVRTLSFNDLASESTDTSNVEIRQVQGISNHKEAQIEIDGNLSGKTIVVDLYQANFEDPNPDTRFVIVDDSTTTEFTQLNNMPVSSGLTINQEDFNQILAKRGNAQSINLPLENRAYLATVSIVNNQTDQLEIISPRLTLTPNVCGDESPPIINVTEGEDIEVSVSKPIEINVGESTDAETEIVEIYIDTDLDQDADADGNPINDRDLQGAGELRNVGRFRLSAVQETGVFQVAVWAIDAAGNTNYQIITVNVVAPRIVLDDVTQTQVDGHLETTDGNVPLQLIRNRNGLLQEISETTTASDGTFEFDNLTVSDLINIFDVDNEKLFEISQSTGSIRGLQPNAQFLALPAVPGESPTTIQLRDEDRIITNLIRVSESNNDVEILNSRPRNNVLASKKGVIAVSEISQNDYELRQIAGDDPGFAGGAAIFQGSQRQAIIDTDGSIIILDDSLSLILDEVRSVQDYQWFEIRSGNRLVASIFVGTAGEEVQIGSPSITPRTSQPAEAPEEQPAPTEDSTEPSSTFSDIPADDPDREVFNYLESVGVIDGVQRDGQVFYEPDRFLARAEYAKIILKTMCIEPRPEAFEEPIAFYDIPFIHNLPWYYDETKETKLQGFFTGYLAEVDLATGLTPFKPEATITRAEATKVILEALESKEVVDLSGLPTTEVWYESFITAARDMSDIIVDPNYEGTTFLLTNEEANAPLRNVNRREFAIMAYRVLLVTNCLEEDNDSDGIPYYYEVENDLDPNQDDGSADNDGDGITNLDEYQEGGDPSQPAARNQVTPGIFLEGIPCQSCPCLYRLEFETDILPGDELFAILESAEGNVIHRRSNTVTYSQ